MTVIEWTNIQLIPLESDISTEALRDCVANLSIDKIHEQAVYIGVRS